MAIRYMVEKHYNHINYQKSLDCLFDKARYSMAKITMKKKLSTSYLNISQLKFSDLKN